MYARYSNSSSSHPKNLKYLQPRNGICSHLLMMEEIDKQLEREKNELAALREELRQKERDIQDLVKKKERLKEEEEEDVHSHYEDVPERSSSPESGSKSNAVEKAQKSPGQASRYQDGRRPGEGYYYVADSGGTLGSTGACELRFEDKEDGYQTMHMVPRLFWIIYLFNIL